MIICTDIRRRYVLLFSVVCCWCYWRYIFKGHRPVVMTGIGIPKLKGRALRRNHSDVKESRILADTSPMEVMKIDLDVEVPSVDELFERLVLVTSFSANHFEEALGFFETAQKYMPDNKIIAYDLGLSRKQRWTVESLCNVVRLRTFPFEKYPPHYKNLRSYAFKPTIINIVVNEFGVVYYGDASIRFRKSIKELIPEALQHHGWLVHIRSFDPLMHRSDFDLTVPSVYPLIGVNRTEVQHANLTYPSISAGIMLLINNTYLQKAILQPWLVCALDQPCIAPNGTSLGNHRFDQSALSLLAYKNMYKEFTPEKNPTQHHMKLVSIKRNSKASKFPEIC